MAADHPLLRCAAERRPLPDGFPPAEKYSLIQSYTSQDPAAYNGYLLAFAKNDELGLSGRKTSLSNVTFAKIV